MGVIYELLRRSKKEKKRYLEELLRSETAAKPAEKRAGTTSKSGKK